MARLARLVVPGLPHHITQRGNRRQKTFFTDQDYEHYINLMARQCLSQNVDIWAYCLMPNHVHLIAVPKSVEALRLAIGEGHRRYTKFVNLRQDWRGHLWQGRFASFVLDDAHLLEAVRYIELNPIRAGLARKPEAYQWSSARAHITGKADRLVKPSSLDHMVGDWRQFLNQKMSKNCPTDLRRHERTGRPLGSDAFIKKLEELSGRRLRCQQAGRKKKDIDK
ncbi:MAG TPA: transposase [Actinobacteria bacterium]|nr:transposase [Actinomycetota bacterium]